MDKIKFVISRYKANFDTVNVQERYKWEALRWYQEHWNIDAENFSEMLANAFSKASNLLSSSMYYPYKMITEYAKADPEEVRRIFRVLDDERVPIEERYQVFRDSCKIRIDQIMKENPDRQKTLNHYQDVRAIMVYLTFQYPEKYYLYKSTMYTTFRDRIGFSQEKAKQYSAFRNVDYFIHLCDIIVGEIKNDTNTVCLCFFCVVNLDSCYIRNQKMEGVR